MAVMWATLNPTAEPIAIYGLSPENLNLTAHANRTTYAYGGWRGTVRQRLLAARQGDPCRATSSRILPRFTPPS
jgi:hypothetical protein